MAPPPPPPPATAARRVVSAAGLVAEAARALGPLAGVQALPPHAVRALQSAVDVMAAALPVRDPRFFGALGAGSRSLIELRTVWRRRGGVDRAAERGIADLSTAFRRLRASYGLERLRYALGSPLAASEAARLDAMRLRAARLRARASALAARARQRGDAALAAELARLDALLARTAAAQASLAAYLNAAIRDDLVQGEWAGIAPYLSPDEQSESLDGIPDLEGVTTGPEAGYVFAGQLGSQELAAVWSFVERDQDIGSGGELEQGRDAEPGLAPFSGFPEGSANGFGLPGGAAPEVAAELAPSGQTMAAGSDSEAAWMAAGAGQSTVVGAPGGMDEVAGESAASGAAAAPGLAPERGVTAEPPETATLPPGTLIVHGGGGGTEVVGREGRKFPLAQSADRANPEASAQGEEPEADGGAPAALQGLLQFDVAGPRSAGLGGLGPEGASLCPLRLPPAPVCSCRGPLFP